MGFDFALILVIGTLLTGVVWAIDALYLRRRRLAEYDRGNAAHPPGEPVLVDYARTFFPILLIVLIVRSFLFEPFRIPSSSMVPTLLVGDFIFVNKYVYGLRLPVTNTKIVPLGQPTRGDVVVFKLPSDPQTNYIKRVVGLPGDVVAYRDRRIYVNGKRVEIELNGVYTEGEPRGAHLGTENLAGVEHQILLRPDGRSREGEFSVPEGHYFLMGDNRDNSQDSRYPQVGFIPEGHLVGKAVRIWMNWDWHGATPIWGRIGDKIT